jgi:charged multivesicular body protein 2A
LAAAKRRVEKVIIRSVVFLPVAPFIRLPLSSHLQGCALKLQTVKSHAAMAEAMQNTAKAMKKMNKAVNVKSITQMMAEFERENARAEMMQEVMGDAIDDALADEEGEEEEERIVNQVLDEIGISFQEELPEAAGLGVPAAAEAEGPSKVAQTAGGGAEDAAVSELEARLNNLKR